MSLARGFKQVDRVADQLTARRLKRELLPLYRESLDEIRKKLAALYESHAVDGALTYTEVAKYNRLANLEKAVAKEIQALGAKVKPRVKTTISQVYQESFYRTAFVIEKEVQAKLKFGQLPKKQIEAAIVSPFGWPDSVQDSMRTALRQVRNEITRGLIQGEAYPDVAKRVAERMGVAASRAETIVRTEAHRARELGKIESLEHAFEQGVDMTKVWDSALDDRTRDSHQELDGQEVPMFDEDGEPGQFVNPETGDTAEYPGDFGVASEDINCRCSVRGQIAGYEPQVRRSKEDGVIPYQTYKEYAKEKGWPVRG